MKSTYILRVDCGKDKIKIVSDILGVDTNSNNYWEQILIEEALDPPVNFVDRFLKIIEGKYQKLSMVGVHIHNISVWIYYEYDEQCNMSFSPEDMKRLGDNQITLCISCWEAHSKDTHSNHKLYIKRQPSN